MHPLEALGLARDADERAVKRAYAQRLRKARPDEDPAGFQDLHETYQAALSYVRWRAEHPDEAAADDEPEPDEADESDAPPGRILSEAEFAELIGNPRYAPGSDPPARPEESPRPPPIQRVAEEPEPFKLDLRRFLDRLLDEIEREAEADDLRDWLARETADWPMMVVPRVAHGVLDHLVETQPSLTPEQLEVIVRHFGLDDVRTGIDPIGLEELRLEAAKRRRQRRRLFAHLFHPDRRAELCRYMARPERGGHFGLTTRLVVYLLTSSRAYEWAFFLRPFPLVNRFVMRFLRDIDEGRFDGFEPYIDAMALQFWEWAEMRREANRRLRWALIIFALFTALSYVAQDPPRAPSSGSPSRPGRTTLIPERDRGLADRIRRAIGMENAAALAEYDAILRDATPPWSPLAQEVVAIAHYNRGVVLNGLGRKDEARRSYETVDRLFGTSNDWPVQLVTARALVNLGLLQADGREFREAVVTFGKVVVRYGDVRRREFDVQVARALTARASAFEALGEPDEVRHALDDLLRRFGDRTTDDLRDLVARAKERRQALDAK